MARKKDPERKDPDLEPTKAVGALEEQLGALQAFKERRARDVEYEEKEWQHLTQNIIARAFGDPTRNLRQFYSARNAGRHNFQAMG